MELEKLCPVCHSMMRLVVIEPETTLDPVAQFKCVKESCGHQEPLYGREEEGEA